MMSKTKAFIIFSNACVCEPACCAGGCVKHVAITLEQLVDNEIKYYRIESGPDETPEASLTIFVNKSEEHLTFRDSLEKLIQKNEFIELEVEGNINEIAHEWIRYSKTVNYDVFSNNCADSAAWFLNRYANIPNPGPCSPPNSCNLIFCCFFAPNYLQPCTIAGRVADYTRATLKQRKNNEMLTDRRSLLSMER